MGPTVRGCVGGVGVWVCVGLNSPGRGVTCKAGGGGGAGGLFGVRWVRQKTRTYTGHKGRCECAWVVREAGAPFGAF